MNTKLKQYVKGMGLTQAQAAAELEITRQYLSGIIHGMPCGRKLAKKIEVWSGGTVQVETLLYPAEK